MKRKFYKKGFLMTMLLCLSAIGLVAQPSIGGTPPSFKDANASKASMKTYQVEKPDVLTLLNEDVVIKNSGYAPRAAVILPLDLTISNSGEWEILPTGERIWRLAIQAKDAKATLLTYSDFYLPRGSRLYVYNKDKTQVLGAYTHDNNPIMGPEFSTELLAGDVAILEYVSPLVIHNKGSGAIDPKTGQTKTDVISPKPFYENPIINISGIGYAYNDNISVTKQYDGSKTPSDLGSSGSCMVNINCAEGATWQNQKKGVAATLQKIGSSYYICSGSLINNLKEDLTPYFLMAWHCSEASGKRPTAADYNQWQFYFHWERESCSNTSSPVAYKTITGCQQQTEIALTGGSDGLLLRFNNAVPINYDVYYNGWDASTATPANGVSIHHPSGDVKKVSTYTSGVSATTANISGYGAGASNAHWGFQFQATTNGHGVTEGGSSGSPMFNNAGLIVGTLTGGNSSCSSPNGNNLYGRMWYHFDQSQNPASRMKTFLDPDNTGARVCQGRYASTEPIANFAASKTKVYAMEPVQFYNQSFNATSYYWEFEGGTPATSTAKDPVVVYNQPGGPYNVTLTINGGASSKTATSYITSIEKELINQVTVGTGTSTANYPLGYANNNARVHQATLYTPAQLGSAGTFSSIAWYAGTARTIGRTINVYMMHTDATDVTGVAAWNIGAVPPGATHVASYPAQPNIVGWNAWDFNVANFSYNGTQNVIIFVEVYAAANSSIISTMTNTCRYTATGTNTNRVWQSNASTQPTTVTATNNQCPNLILLKGVPSVAPVANFKGPIRFNSAIKENFDLRTPFPPKDWTKIQKVTNSNYTWASGNPNANPFNNIDPSNVYSATIGYSDVAGQNQDEWIITYPLTVEEVGTLLQFYAGYSCGWLSGAHLECKIATEDGGYTDWTQVWTTGTTNNTSITWAWYKIEKNLDAYVGKRIKIGFQYVGFDGDLAAIDNVAVGKSDELGKFLIFTDELLQLTDLSQGPPVLWEWMNPGSETPVTNSLGEVPSVKYNYPGTYDLGLKVTNLRGTDTKYMTEQLIVKDRTVSSKFSAKPVTGYEVVGKYVGEFHPYIAPGGSVEFKDQSSNNPNAWKWELQGAAPETSSEKNITANYYQEGNFDAQLTATNSQGGSTVKQDKLVKVGYDSEWVTNSNIDGGVTGNFTVGTNLYLGGSGFTNNIAEYYEAPMTPGTITGIVTYIGGKGSSSRDYTLQICKATPAGPGAVLAQWSFNINQLATITEPALRYFALDEPMAINEPFFIVVNNFTTYATGTYLAYMATIGDSLPEDEYSTAWVKSANYTGGIWAPVSDVLIDNPAVSYALWPEFSYTKLEVSEDAITLPKTGAVNELTVSSNVPFTATTTDSWYTLNTTVDKITVDTEEVVTGGKIKVTFQTNTGAARTGSFTVTGGGVTRTIEVLQLAGDALTLYVNPNAKTVTSVAGSDSFGVTGNVKWQANCNANWLTIVNDEGTGAGTLSFTYMPNTAVTSRATTINIKGGGLTRTVTVTQEGSEPYLTINPEGGINVDKLDGLRGIAVKSNVNWIATTSASWLTLTNFAGTGDGYTYYEYLANPTAQPRIATIEIVAGSIVRTLTVTQAAGSTNFTVNPSNIIMASNANSQNISLTVDNTWNAVIDINSASWLSATPNSGSTGTSNVSIAVTENTASTPREATITFNNGSLYRYLVVRQEGKQTLTVNKNSASVAYTNGDESINVTSNSTWIAVSKAEWITISNPSSNGNGAFVINYANNNGVARQGTVEVTVPGSSLKQVITINQASAPSYTVTLPTAPVGYTITPASGSISPVMQGGNYSFNVVLNANYNQSNPIVKANGTVLTPVGNVYTITNIVTNQIVTVENVNINKYSVSWTSDPNVTVSVLNGSTPVTNGSSVNHGTALTITATAPEGVNINLTVNGSAFTNGGTHTVTAPVVISAVSSVIQYAVNYSSPSTVALVVKNGSTTITSGTKVNYGTVLTITATPDESHLITALTVNGNPFISGNTYTVVGDVNIAVVAAIKTYTITVTQGANGTITPGTIVVNHGANQTFAINANDDYSIDFLTVDGARVNATGSYTFTNVKADHTITATFMYTPGMMNINLPSVEGAIVAAVPGYSSPVEFGSEFKFTVTLDEGYTQSTPIVMTNGNLLTPVAGVYKISNITSSQIVTVTGIALNMYYVTLPTVTGATVTATNGVYNSSKQAYEVKYGDDFNFNVTLQDAYSQSNYVVGPAGLINSTGNGTYAIENVKSDVAVTVQGLEINKYYITLPTTEGAIINALTGIYDPMAQAYKVEYGTNFQFEVILNPAYSQSNYFVGPMMMVMPMGNGKFGINNVTENIDVTIQGVELNIYYLTLPTVEGATVTAIDATFNPVQECYEVEHGQGFRFSVMLDEAHNQSNYIVRANGNQLYLISGSLQNGIYGVQEVLEDTNITVVGVSKNNFDITVNQAPNGTITPGTSTVEYGASQTFTITPNTGYYIKDVKVDGVTVTAVSEYTFTNVTKNHTITAEFAIRTYTLTVVQTNGGTISPATSTINHGGNRLFTIAANANYKLIDVLVDGTSVGAVTSYSFNNVNANHTITAAFELNTYTIAVNQTANGTIAPETVSVAHGGTQSFTITPASGYHIASVRVDGINIGAVASYTFNNVTANHSITATFAETIVNTYTIIATAGLNGTITPTGAVTVTEGNSQTFTMQANEGYVIDNVMVDGISIGNVAEYTFNTVMANHAISVTFREDVGVNDVEPLSSKVYSYGMNIYVQMSEAASVQIEIIDMTGRIVKQLSSDNTQTTTATMSAQGTYIVRVISEHKTISNDKVIVR